MLILSESQYQPAQQNTITVVVIHQQEILLLQRNPNAYPNYVDPFPRAWELIGGGVEPGEDPQIAACREIYEETGIIVATLKLIGISPFSSKGAPANNWIYIAQVESKPLITLSNEHLAYAWQPLVKVLQMSLAFKHSQLLEVIVNTAMF
jgi:8-oxo-dGTP pyrophosphatase MutT (NUDIX family)